jgi:cell division protein FtsL
MFTKLNDIKVALPRVLIINLGLVTVVFFAGVFYNQTSNLSTEIHTLDQRVAKKVAIQNGQSQEIDALENNQLVLQTEVKNLKEELNKLRTKHQD